MKAKLFILLFFGWPALMAGQNPDRIIESQSEKIFESNVRIEQLVLADSVSVSSNEDDQAFIIRSETGGGLLGYACASSAMGRYEKFDYFFITDETAGILLVKVWQYRSSHGGAIAGKRWLKQFEGFKGGNLEYGKDIQALSGATISGNSIVSDIERLHGLLKSHLE